MSTKERDKEIGTLHFFILAPLAFHLVASGCLACPFCRYPQLWRPFPLLAQPRERHRGQVE